MATPTSASTASTAAATLRHITDRKLGKVGERKAAFAARRAAAEAEALHAREAQLAAAGGDGAGSGFPASAAAAAAEAAYLSALITGLLSRGIDVQSASEHLGLPLASVQSFLQQARADASVSAAVVARWREAVEADLAAREARFDYADLFGKLVTEWMDETAEAGGGNGGNDGSEAEVEDGFDLVDGGASSVGGGGGGELEEQRRLLEAMIFEVREVDAAAIVAYLDGLFAGSRKARGASETPLEALRSGIRRWAEQWKPQKVTSDEVEDVIRELLAANIFTDARRAALADLLARPELLREMVDVLRMDLAELDSWDWAGPVPWGFCRQVNGRYRAFMDEEIHTAILLQWVGTNLAVALRGTFMDHFNKSGAWVHLPHHAMSKEDRQRRHAFLGKNAIKASNSVSDVRRAAFRDQYFIVQLPESTSDAGGWSEYNDNKPAEGRSGSGPTARQSLLRLLTTEMLLHRILYGEFTVLASDFKTFGPSMPHATVRTVLSYFGLPDRWLSFLDRFLAAPLVYAAAASPDAGTGTGAVTAKAVQIRRRGLPTGRTLSDAMGEAVLFCLDFAVHARTDGAALYRFHDDMWFFGTTETCARAWAAIREFAVVMGLELNAKKTGSARIVDGARDSAPPTLADNDALPKGPVRWGFLVLDEREGVWNVDQGQVDAQVVELRRQLGACRSVFRWVQTWNSSMAAFFSRHFGVPARCLGKRHIDAVVAALTRIQRGVFDGRDYASVPEHLRRLIRERFPGAPAATAELPDSFFYYPVELGGLGLINPLVPLFVRAEGASGGSGEPSEVLERAVRQEEEAWEAARERFEAGELAYDASAPRTYDGETFMPLEEGVRFLEQTSDALRRAYTELQEEMGEASAPCPAEFGVQGAALFAALGSGGRSGVGAAATSGLGARWGEHSTYWKWTLALYAGEAKRRFGGPAAADRGLLPLGLVSALRSERSRLVA